MSKITNEMHKLLGEAAKSPDTAEIKHAKKQYMHMPEAMSMLNDMMDALSNINDPRAREANDDMSKAMRSLDRTAETMRLMGLHKA